MKDKGGKIRGFVKVEVWKDASKKELLSSSYGENVITSAALAAISGLVGNTGAQTAFTYLAVGTGSTAAAISQTALVAEISDSGLARAAATVSRVTTTQTNDTLRLVYTWTASGTKTVEECGIFNASSSGVMLGRKVTGSQSLISGNLLAITYDVVFPNA